MAPATAAWGDQIAVETLHGVPFRMYTERPRRVESLLAYADRWGDAAAHHPGRSRRSRLPSCAARSPPRRASSPTSASSTATASSSSAGTARSGSSISGRCLAAGADPRPRQHLVEREGSCQRPRGIATRPHAGRRPCRGQDARGSAMRSVGHPSRARAGQRYSPRLAGRGGDRAHHLHLGHVGPAESRRPVASRRAGAPAHDAAGHAEASAPGGRIGARRRADHGAACSTWARCRRCCAP